MRRNDDNEPRSEQGPPRIRFWNTLFFRLALLVNLSVIGVLVPFSLIDHRRERIVHTESEIGRLREEAKVLRVGRSHSPDLARFQEFVDAFCRQMGTDVSPGHHIAVIAPSGEVLVRAHERADSDLEREMAKTPLGHARAFQFGGEDYVSVALDTGFGEAIVLAQSLAQIEPIIQAQQESAIASTGILVSLIFGVTTIGSLIWVRDPLRNLVRGVARIAHGDFAARVSVRGASELQYLGSRINEMARSIETVERGRLWDLQRARAIQRSLLPPARAIQNGFMVTTVFEPAESVGGDMYDVIPLPDGSVLIATLDVSGHGVPAALYAAILRSALHHQTAATSDVETIAGAMNREFASVATQGTFATCFLARLQRRNGDAQIEYVNAGHDPALVISDGSEIARLAGENLVMGVDPEHAYRSGQARLHHGERLFLFTDGIHEVRGADDRLLGRDRLADLLIRFGDLAPAEQVQAVLREVRHFQGRDRFDDDITLLSACIAD